MPPMLRTLHARLVYAQAGPPVPLHHLSWRAAVHRSLLPDPAAGDGTTDLDGRLVLDLGGHEGARTVALTLLDHQRRYRDGGVVDEAHEAGTVTLEVPAEAADGDDLGDVQVGWWPYRTDFPLPRAGTVDGKLPQAYTKGFERVLLTAVAEGAPAQALLRGIHAVEADGPSPERIQAHQARTLTVRTEAAEPGRTRSDAWLADQLLNGFDIALHVGRDAEDPGRLRAVIAWGDMPAKGDFDLTDVDVGLVDRDGTLVVDRISLRTRQPGAGGAWARDTTRAFTPGDADWEAAKRVVRCQLLLHGALMGHITCSHFQTEMVALACFRHLRHNPVRHVLAPHLQEIVKQGADGDGFAWGPDGILAKQSALTVPALHRHMVAFAAARDWKTWQPRTMVHPSHRYAAANQVYWEVLGAYLDGVFAAQRSAIEAAWPEVRRFSDELVRRSLPYQPEVFDPRVVPVDRNERDQPELPRATVAGVVRAVRPVTTTDTPQPGEVDALKQLCRYFLHQATFNHTWTHDGQYDAGGELAYATFGLRAGSLGAEDDPTVLPPPLLNIEALSTNTLGTRANYGYLVADEERDVPPALRAALEARRAELEALGVDVDHIRSRINI